MPNGKVHTKVTLLIAAEYTVATVISLNPGNTEYVVGALLGVLLHPDLDVDHGRVESYRLVRRLGSGPYHFSRILWYPYRKSIKHGSALSHFPVLGTVGRLAYLFLFVIALPYLVIAPVLHLDMRSELWWWLSLMLSHYRIILGLMTTDLFHWFMDVVTTEHKHAHS